MPRFSPFVAQALGAVLGLVLGGCGRLWYDPLPLEGDAGISEPSDASSEGPRFYIAATGGADTNDGTSAQSAWATFAHAWTMLRPGDTLVLLDGTYLEVLSPSISGTPNAPVVIRADREGGAVIDGEGARRPCEVKGTVETPLTDIVIEGIRCQNSSSAVFYVVDAERVAIRRVTAYEATAAMHAFWVNRSQDVLLEDVAASGLAENLYRAQASSRVVFRRCWGRWTALPNNESAVLMLLESSDCLVENCIAVADPAVVNGSGPRAFNIFTTTSGTLAAQRNRLVGSVARGMGTHGFIVSSPARRVEGNMLVDAVSLDNPTGVYQRADADLFVDHVTCVGASGAAYGVSPSSSPATKAADFEVGGTVSNAILANGNTGFSVSGSSYVTSFVHRYNDLAGLTEPYRGTVAAEGELVTTPAFDEATYGSGAFLLVPGNLRNAGEGGTHMGAEVRHRYEDGVLTTTPLWPWPMEERIVQETGQSVTWEAQGGFWKTLDGLYP